MGIEGELIKALDTLYAKPVPANVREFIDLRSGTSSDSLVKPPRKPKPPFSSVVGESVKEMNSVESPGS